MKIRSTETFFLFFFIAQIALMLIFTVQFTAQSLSNSIFMLFEGVKNAKYIYFAPLGLFLLSRLGIITVQKSDRIIYLALSTLPFLFFHALFFHSLLSIGSSTGKAYPVIFSHIRWNSEPIAFIFLIATQISFILKNRLLKSSNNKGLKTRAKETPK